MQELALGQLGYTEQEFWDMTPRALLNALEGYQKQRREDMEVMRLQTLYAVNVWANPPINDPKRLWRYAWEKEKKIDVEKVREKGKKLAEKWQAKR